MLLIRHGQTIFNVVYGRSRRDPRVPDPELTEEGHRQALAAAETLAGHGIELIVASPYRRAIQTAHVVAEAHGLPVTIDTRARERFAFTCDVGSPRSALAESWPGYDFSDIEETWWPEAEETEASFVARCEAFVAHWSADPRWNRIAVITHWGVIRALTGERMPNGSLIRLKRP